MQIYIREKKMFRTLKLGGCPKVQRSDAKTKLWNDMRLVLLNCKSAID